MSSNHRPTCPHCLQDDQIYKVSLLYLEGSAFLNRQVTVDLHDLERTLADILPGTQSDTVKDQAVNRIVSLLAPPSGGRRLTRRIHPDTVVIFFSCFALLFLYQVIISSPRQAPIIALLLAAGITGYLFARKSIVTRHQNLIQQEQEENARVEQAVSRWMRLYFCTRDQGVFDPEQNTFFPVERMKELLYE